MALYEKGEGILSTHVTWEDIQEKCKAIFGEKAVFGPNKSVTNVGDNRGFMSKMCLIEPDWQDRVDADIPQKFVVKISSQMAFMENNEKMIDLEIDVAENPFMSPAMLAIVEASVRKVHNNEINAYKILQSYGNKHLPHPKIYYMEPFSEENKNKGYIIMSFIENVSSLTLYNNLTTEEIKQPLRALAVLNAISLRFSDEERAMFKMDVIKDLYAQMLTPDAIGLFFVMTRKIADQSLLPLVDKCETIVADLTDMEKLGSIAKDLGMQPVLSHGDLWTANLLFNNNGQHDLLAVVDFQTASMGMTCSDICRLLAACLSGKDRREHWENLVETFYGYLKEEVGELPMPYTLEQLKESIRRFLPFGYFLIVNFVGPVFEMSNSLTDEEEKAKIRAAILEKTQALLEDIWDQHQKNKASEK